MRRESLLALMGGGLAGVWLGPGVVQGAGLGADPSTGPVRRASSPSLGNRPPTDSLGSGAAPAIPTRAAMRRRQSSL